MELRRVDPRILKDKRPGTWWKDPARRAVGTQSCAASMKTVGILQPPAVTEKKWRAHHRLRRGGSASPYRSAFPRSTSWSKTPTIATRCGR